MSISPIGPNSPITRLQGSTAVGSTQGSQDVSNPREDTVEISAMARYLGELKKLPDIREEKVQAARQAIAAGTYETPDKVDKVVAALMEEWR